MNPEPTTKSGQGWMRAYPVGGQIQDLLLEHAFHLAARAMELLVKPSRREACFGFVLGKTLAGISPGISFSGLPGKLLWLRPIVRIHASSNVLVR